jgi:tetratricopeptide (TPR) repeat protein
MSQAAASRATLNEVIELINAGKRGEAEAICRDAIQRNPDDINMTALLGAMLLKAREMAEAERFLRHAIELAPSFAKPHEDLGYLLVEQGRPEEALPILNTATRLDPTLERAHLCAGKALALLGRGKEADVAFEKSFELNPLRKKLAVAAEHQKAGRLKEAKALCREILRAHPENVDALRMMGTAALTEGHVDEAERFLRRVVTLAPDFVDAIIDLGQALKEQGRFEEAIGCFRDAIENEPANVRAHFLMAGTLSPSALTYEAIEAFQRTIELRPNHAGAWLGLGHVLKTVGRQDEAINAYRECIRLRPENGATYWSLANLKTYRLSSDDIEAMETQLENGDLDKEFEVNFLFALAKATEDRGDFDGAWKYYEQGNAERRAMEYYDPVRAEDINDRVIEVFDQAFLDEHGGQGHADSAPIFVIGLPRSGSTLIEQILASHSQVEGTSELPYVAHATASLNLNRADGVNYPEAVRELGPRQLTALGKGYLRAAQMHRTEGAPHFIDKMPNNFPSVGFIHLILPNAKIIDARRQPMDSCLSCFRQLFARGQPFTYDLTDIGEYFLEYQRLMDHWHQVLPGRALTVQYEDVVQDFENQVRRLLDYCELPWEDSCVRFFETDRPVRTASSEQVRQPIHSKSVNFWRNFEDKLEELIGSTNPSIRPNMARLPGRESHCERPWSG